MPNSFWLVLFCCSLGLVVILWLSSDSRKNKVMRVAQADAEDAKASRSSIVQDIRELNATVRVLAFHHASDPALRAHLITSLAEADVLCAHCPLRQSSLCEECGRFASGEGRKEHG